MHLYGSVNNRIAEASVKGMPKPEVGTGCTITMWTDRHAATVTYVSPSGKTVKVRRDKATRVDKLGLTDSGQRYTYERDPEAEEETFRLTKRGWSKPRGGSGLVLGRRDEYYDPSF